MNDRAASAERRAYWRLLRHLLSKEVEAAYSNDRPDTLPPDMEALLVRLDHQAPGSSGRAGE